MPRTVEHKPEQKLEIKSGSHAIVIGGSMAGLLAARVLVDYFDWVTIVERDEFPEQPQVRQGVPQATHVHVLLTRGQQILKQLFPGIEAELIAAGAPTIDWIADWFMFGMWGLSPRFPSNLKGQACSRHLLEWTIRRRLAKYDNLKFLEATQVTQLLADENKSKVTGVRLRYRARKEQGETSKLEELAANLVVDASGRNSSMPKWLKDLGYNPPVETTIDSFLGYASRWYRQKEGFPADWQGVTVMAKAPENSRGGVLFPVEGNRWVVTLAGLGRDYPPTDEEGFLAFARSLRSPILYEAIADAEPLSPIYGYRRTENRLRHYEKLSKLPEGLVIVGDAVCAFNPVYGQGMTISAMGALTLDECLREQFKTSKRSLKGLTQRFQKRLAQVNETPWLMATGEDLRWPTTSGGQVDGISRLMQGYIDRVMQFSVNHPEAYQTFGEVAHLVKSPTALFKPGILAPVLWQSIGEIFQPNG